VVALAGYFDLTTGDRRFALDSATDTLYRLDGPGSGQAGTLSLIGPLNVDTSDLAGMDADYHDGVLYAALTVGGSPGLYTIDQTTGHATLLAAIGSAPITSLTMDVQGGPAITLLTAPSPGLNPGEVLEASTVLDVSVRRTGDDIVAADYLVETFSDTATAGLDFVAKSELLHFDAGEVEKHISVAILDDAVREGPENFHVSVKENAPNGTPGLLYINIVDDDNDTPTLTVTSPSTSPITVSGPTLTISGTFTDEDAGTKVSYYQSNFYFPDGTSTTSPWSFDVPLNPGHNTIAVSVADPYGAARGKTLEVWRADVADQTFFFAEGATGSFFTTDLLFANPNFAEIPVTIDFMREDGTVVPYALTLPPMQQTLLRVDTVPGLQETAMSSVVHTNSYPIVVERTMRWGTDARGVPTEYGASTEKGARALSKTWLFAEGSQGFFSTFLLLVNPQPTANTATVRFLREQNGPITKTYPIAPHQRLTIDAGSIPEVVNQSFGMEVTFDQPGMAERAMYFGSNPLWSGGHASAGAPAPATEWFLAEGATGPFFETFVLVANPSSETATLTFTYLPSTGVPITQTKVLPANSRLTVNIEGEDPALTNAAVATRVTSTTPIIVERSQYWPFSPDQWYEAHNSFGQTAPGTHWGLAEGRVGSTEEYVTYILLANPQTTPAEVAVTFLPEGGTPFTKHYTVAPTSRFNISIDRDQTDLGNIGFGADITSSVPIMVERSLYWSAIGQDWAAGTNATATRLP
jgi:hypothetical protein